MREQGAEGADGNARLTGATGVVLLVVGFVVVFVEGITLLEVRQLITLHIFLGLLLIPPTVLYVCSTYAQEFGFGLDLILDGLERARGDAPG